jgi:hypothetical protein
VFNSRAMQQQRDVQPGSPVFESGSFGICVTRLESPLLIEEMESIVSFFFGVRRTIMSKWRLPNTLRWLPMLKTS